MDRFYSPQGGTEGQLSQLISALDRRRVDPRLVVFRQSDYLRDNPFPCQAEVLHISALLRLSTLLKLVRLSYRIRQSRIDVVHILLNDASIVAPFFCKIGGAKVIVSRRDMGHWYTPLNLAVLSVSNLFVDRAVANCRAVATNVAKREGLPVTKIDVIYNGHDVARFSKSAQPDFRRHGIGPDEPVIGMVASLYPMKRHADLLKAFAIARRRFLRAHVALVGDAPEEAKMALHRLAESLGIQQHVHFLGVIPDVIPVIHCFNVCVLCSDSEGLSNAIMEYMGCGKPTICTNVGGSAELIDDGETGFLIIVGDVEALAHRIAIVLGNPSLAAKLGTSAKAKLARSFSFDRMVNSYTGLYEALANEACGT